MDFPEAKTTVPGEWAGSFFFYERGNPAQNANEKVDMGHLVEIGLGATADDRSDPYAYRCVETPRG